MSYDVPVPAAQQNFLTSFTVGNTNVAQILVPLTPGQVMPAVTGESALYGETAVRQRVFQGGCRIFDLYATTTDTVTANLVLHEGLLMSSFSAVAASGMQPAVTGFTTGTITGTNVINRTAGSFITEGWAVGKSAIIFGDVTQPANNGILLQVTGVTALALTFTGTPLTNETIAAGFQLYQIGRITEVNIPLSSGNTNTAPNVPLIGPYATQNKSLDQTGISLGANGVLIGNLVANLSALPARMDVVAKAFLY